MSRSADWRDIICCICIGFVWIHPHWTQKLPIEQLFLSWSRLYLGQESTVTFTWSFFWDITSHRMSLKTFWSKIFPTMITPNDHVISQGITSTMEVPYNNCDRVSPFPGHQFSIFFICYWNLTVILDWNQHAGRNDWWVYNWAYPKSQIMTNKFVMTVFLNILIQPSEWILSGHYTLTNE